MTLEETYFGCEKKIKITRKVLKIKREDTDKSYDIKNIIKYTENNVKLSDYNINIDEDGLSHDMESGEHNLIYNL